MTDWKPKFWNLILYTDASEVEAYVEGLIKGNREWAHTGKAEELWDWIASMIGFDEKGVELQNGIREFCEIGRKKGYDSGRREALQGILDKMPDPKDHICRFNDGDCKCDCVYGLDGYMRTLIQSQIDHE